MGHLLSIRTRLPYFHGLATARSWADVRAVLRAGIGFRLPIVLAWIWSVIIVFM